MPGMFRTVSIVLVLMGLVPTAASQISIGARVSRHVSVGATFGRGGVGIGVSLDSHRHRGHRAPVVHHRHGHYKHVSERVFVPGCSRQVWVPAQYGWVVDSCGHRRWGVVCAGYYRTVQEPGCWQTVTRRVWVPGC
jgi:hypothetical protein